MGNICVATEENTQPVIENSTPKISPRIGKSPSGTLILKIGSINLKT